MADDRAKPANFMVIQFNYKTERDRFFYFKSYDESEKFVLGADRENYSYTIAKILGKY